MSFVHLHCHSEYSLLDGANRIDDLIARALELEQPALAITDHGNLHAAWEFQEKAKKAKLKPIIGMEAYVAPGDRRVKGRADAGREAVLPSGAARAGHGGLQEPGQALLARLHGRLLHQAARRSGAARQVQRGADRELRVPRRRSRHQARGGRHGGRARGRLLVRRRLQGPLLPRGAGARLRGAGPAQRADPEARRGAEPADRGDERRALPARHGPRRARRAAVHRPGEGLRRPEPDALRPGPLLQERSGDAVALPGAPRRAGEHAPDRRRGGIRVREEVLRPVVPAPARGEQRERAARDARDGGRARAVRRRAAAGGAGAARLRAGRDHEDGLRRLLPDRVRLHQGGARPGHPGRSRTRLGGGIDRRVRAADHGRLPAQVRSPVRALPESRARVDAGHRRRLLLRAARRGDRVRPAEVRQGIGRADRHVRNDEVARRDQGRRPDAGLHPRRDGRAREADPERAGLLAHREGSGEGGAGDRAGLQDRRPATSSCSTTRWRSRGSRATRACTRRAW